MRIQVYAALNALFLLAPGVALSQAPNVLDATLSEPNLKTPDISTRDMRAVVSDGSSFILDSRSKPEFDAGHIPGAHHLAGATPDAVDKLVGGDKQKSIVLYCNGPYCQASRKLGDELATAAFTKVRRYQLGMPVWRAFGGPTAIEIDGVKRIVGADRTAVFIDVRPTEEFAKGTLPGAQNTPLVDAKAGKAKFVLPEDDFNRRVILFGASVDAARDAAEMLKERPWHNVMYVNADYSEIAKAVSQSDR
jgi:rhodanese-related sulfurtransferase